MIKFILKLQSLVFWEIWAQFEILLRSLLRRLKSVWSLIRTHCWGLIKILKRSLLWFLLMWESCLGEREGDTMSCALNAWLDVRPLWEVLSRTHETVIKTRGASHETFQQLAPGRFDNSYTVMSNNFQPLDHHFIFAWGKEWPHAD